jgi:hypothetical protein
MSTWVGAEMKSCFPASTSVGAVIRRSFSRTGNAGAGGAGDVGVGWCLSYRVGDRREGHAMSTASRWPAILDAQKRVNVRGCRNVAAEWQLHQLRNADGRLVLDQVGIAPSRIRPIS